MGQRYKALSSGVESQRQAEPQKLRGSVVPLGVKGGLLLVALAVSGGSPGTAPVTGLEVTSQIGTEIGRGRGVKHVSSFLASTPTLGISTARGRAVDSIDSNFVTGSLSSVQAHGRGKITETGFSSTSAIGTEVGHGRAKIQQGGGYDTGFSSGYSSGIASLHVMGVVTGYGRAIDTPTGIPQSSALGTVTAIGGSGGSGRAIITGFITRTTLAGSATGFSSGFDTGYGSPIFVPAAIGLGRARVEIVGPVQFSFLNPVTGIGLGEVEHIPPFFASLRLQPVLDADVVLTDGLTASVSFLPRYEGDVSLEPRLDGDAEMVPVLSGGE